MQKLYTLLLNLLLPFILLRLIWRGFKQSAYRKRWRERFGYVESLCDSCLWIHAVSLGEVNAAIPLVHALKKNYPNIPIVMTTTTPTGSAQVLNQLKDDVIHVYAPIDLPRFVRRFLNSTHPIVCILMETEIWPNILKCCSIKKIPVCIVNARLSERSLKGYLHIRKFMSRLFWHLSFVGAQTEADAKRFMKLGLSKDKIKVLGNLKFDMTISEEIRERAKILREQIGERPVFVAASTHEGEEEIILSAFKKILTKQKNALLILIPRHPERFNLVSGLISKKQFQFLKRSEMQEKNIASSDAVLLGDTMGEVLLFYACAQIAFVGGSFVSIGGHNLLEPAYFSLPILSGPNLFNFIFIRDALEAAHALKIVNDENALAESVLNYFNDPVLSKQMGERAHQVFKNNQGTCEKYLNWLQKIIAAKPSKKF